MKVYLMTMKRFKSLLFLLLVQIIGLSAIDINIAHAQGDGFSLMSASELPAIEGKSARKYLSGQKTTWPDGTPVVLVILPAGAPEMTWLCQSLIRMPEATYRRFIMEKSLRGGLKIVEVESAEEAVSALKENKGAVAPIQGDVFASQLHAVTIE